MSNPTFEQVREAFEKWDGTVEGPGNNQTLFNKWYFGRDAREPWCATFVSYVLFHVGLPIPATTSKGFAYTPSGAAYFQKRGKWTRKPTVGSLAFFHWANMGRIAHVGWVVKVDPDGSFWSWEGNTDVKGGRTGGRVILQHRSASSIGRTGGFGLLEYANTPTSKQVIPVPAAMKIPAAALVAQYSRASREWPFFTDVERKYGLPRFLLFAVGSRETNLDPAYAKGKLGDNGHGHGLFQWDDQNRPGQKPRNIPKAFDKDPRAQAEKAAEMLRGYIDLFGLLGGLNAYNSGQPKTERTTGKNYGPDVLARMEYLQAVNKPEEDDLIRIITTTHNDDQSPAGVFLEINMAWVKHVPNKEAWDRAKQKAFEGVESPVMVTRGEFDALEKVGNDYGQWPR